MRKIHRLTSLKIAALKQPGRYADGAGLELQISPTGTKSWLFRYSMHGRERRMGLGSLSTVNLKEARELARQARQAILRGEDPLALKRKARADAAKLMTFKECADAFLKAKLMAFTSDKHREQWVVTLAAANRVIGSMNVNDVDTAAVLRVLRPMWDTAPTPPCDCAAGWSASSPGPSRPVIARTSRTPAGGEGIWPICS